jgi:hypothetical protein
MKETKTGKGTKENHVSPYTPNNLGLEKIILAQKGNFTKKINKESRKNARKRGKKIVKSPTRTRIILHQVRILMQI